MDLQLEIAIRETADGYSVIEIARGFAVDGDDRQRAEVSAVAKFLRWDNCWNILRLFERGRGKVVRQVKFADDDFDIDAEVVLAAEDFE